MPEITVLMPVRNGEKYIKDTINSVLKQTLADFEFLIIDDGSTDRTVEIIQEYEDKRIRLIKRDHQFISNLNEGLKLASGTYIARIDADDIMHTERLRIQLKRMKKNPEITVCGSWAKIFGDGGSKMSFSHIGYGIIQQPILELLKHNILLHPSVMIKKEFLLNHQIEYQDYPFVEDYKMWFDIAKAGGVLYVEPQELLMFRVSDTQVTSTNKEEMHLSSIHLRKEILLYLLSFYNNKTFNHLLVDFENLEKSNLISNDEVFRIFINIFYKMRLIK